MTFFKVSKFLTRKKVSNTQMIDNQ